MTKRRIDLVGQRFGMLTVLRETRDVTSGRARWSALCDCGVKTVVQAGNLRAGLTRSCGCRRGGRIDMTGQQFGALTVVAFARSDAKNTYWRVRCGCGAVKDMQRGALVTGRVSSCGCLAPLAHVTHGMEGTKAYAVWASMLQRCRNPKHRAWKNYGGRGITVCERWEKFENFYSDMGEPAGVLDRIDNEKGYAPDNCRWTTWSTSNQNKRPRPRKAN